MSVSSNSGWSQGSSQGTSSGSSRSTSYIPEQEPQLDFLTQFGNTAGRLGSQQYDWAQDQFENNSDLTEDNVNGYLTQSDLASQSAQRDYANYNDTFNPAMDSLVGDAQSYLSPERVASEMGRSEADVAQNFDAQRANLERNLQSYGVNPSDPRYAGAMAASRTAQAAAEAGGGTQARLATEATGRNLRTQVLQQANLLPGQMATEANVAMQGRTGAQNAALANTSTGALTLGTTPNYLNSGIADVKFSPLGTISSSSNTGQNSSQNTSGNQGGSTTGGGSSGGSGSGGRNPSSGQQQPSTGGRMASPPGGQNRSAQPGSSNPSSSSNPNRGSGNGGGSPGAGITNVPPYSGGEGDGGFDPNTGLPYDPNNSGIDPTTGDYYPTPWDGNWGDNPMNDPGFTPGDTDPSLPPAWDPGWGNDPGNWDGQWPEPNPGQTPNIQTDIPMDEFTEQFEGGWAEGGAIPDDMSPSGGEQIDDVPATIQQTGGRAQLNAGEFVVPQDVVQWHGHKFFQDLIQKSRKMRANNPGPAHPSVQQTSQGPVAHHTEGGEINAQTHPEWYAGNGAPMYGTPAWDTGISQTNASNNARAQNIFHDTSWDVNDPAQVRQAGQLSQSMGRYRAANPNATSDQLQQVQHHYTSQPQRASSGTAGIPDNGNDDVSSTEVSSPVSPNISGRPALGATNPQTGTSNSNGWRRSGNTRPRAASSLPTIRNYRAGTGQSQFRPQSSYYQPRNPPQRMTTPSWTNVQRPASITPTSRSTTETTPTTTSPVSPAVTPTVPTGGPGQIALSAPNNGQLPRGGLHSDNAGIPAGGLTMDQWTPEQRTMYFGGAQRR